MTSDRQMVRKSTVAAAAATVAALLTAEPVFAHTGQGTAGLWAGLAHPLLGVDHIFAMITVGVLAMTMARPMLAPASFLASMVVGGALGMVGMRLPGGELAIAVSVVALGGALVAGRLVRPEWALALIAVAGFVHGHAHGVEAPTASHPAVYIGGFVVATAALHLAGVSIGYVIRHRIAARAAFGTVVFGAGLGLIAGFI